MPEPKGDAIVDAPYLLSDFDQTARAGAPHVGHAVSNDLLDQDDLALAPKI